MQGALVVPQPRPRPLGFPLGLQKFGIEPRWVVVDGPAGLSRSRVLELIRPKLVEHLEGICPALKDGLAEAMVEGVELVRQPGAEVPLHDGSVLSLRQVLADSSLPVKARFSLYMADRVLQNKLAQDLLADHALVVQSRGPLSTYACQVVRDGIPTSLFLESTRVLAPQRADLLIVLTPPDSTSGPAAEAYRNPPLSVLHACAHKVAFVSLEDRSHSQIAAQIVRAIAGDRLSFEV